MILLGLGSNLGDRKANLEAALAMLEKDGGVHVLRVSSVYETAALLPENAPPEWDIAFYNAVAIVQTSHTPDALLEIIQHIEQQLGRKNIGRWGPRLIDVDILAYDDTMLKTSNLTIPHADMLSRDFVMLPLAEIAPHWQHPQQRVTAHEWVRQKAMELGEGLMRSHISLEWKKAR